VLFIPWLADKSADTYCWNSLALEVWESSSALKT
jgi:hypothetical protein